MKLTPPQSRARCCSKHHGFSLVELLITLVLGLLISGAVIQILVSNRVIERLNRSISSAQESGRFIISRLRADLIMVGRYDMLSQNLNSDQDIVAEASFVQNHPVILPGDFSAFAKVGSVQGVAGANDKLAVSVLANRDCRGYRLGYASGEEFFVVNEYFVDGKKLKCRGIDGRVLRGQKAAVGHNRHAAFTLLDDIESFQVLYGYANSSGSADNSAHLIRYVTADKLPAALGKNGLVVAIRLAILIKGDAEITISPVPSFKLLNEAAITPTAPRLFKQFETTITLRNAYNFARSRNV